MSRTCVSASERDSRRTDRTGGLHTGHIALALTSVVAMLVIGLAYAGRVNTQPVGSVSDRRGQAPPVIDLNTISSPRELELLLERLFTNPVERKSAAQALFDFIHDVHKAGGVLP